MNRFFLVIFLFSLQGCSAPPYLLRPLNSKITLTSENKEIEARSIIKPEQCQEVLDSLRYRHLSKELNENDVLNFLAFVQELPEKRNIKAWQEPEEVLKEGGDCKGKSVLLASMLTLKGYPASIVLLRKGVAAKFNMTSVWTGQSYSNNLDLTMPIGPGAIPKKYKKHVVVSVVLNGKEYLLETLADKPKLIPVEDAFPYGYKDFYAKFDNGGNYFLYAKQRQKIGG